MDQKQRQQLVEVMQEARERYLTLNAKYDGFLTKAHQEEHGSPAVIALLKDANEIGPALTLALKEYRDAVESLSRFYQQS